MSPTMPLPVTAPATTLRTRRLFQQILATLAVVICILYILEIDLPPLISRQRFRVNEGLSEEGQTSVVPDGGATTHVDAKEPMTLAETYWGKDLASEELLAGLLPFQDSASGGEALSSLGLAADETYHLGTLDKQEYEESLKAFVRSAFPSNLQQRLLSGISAYLDSDIGQESMLDSKHAWQTAKEDYGPEDGKNHLLDTWRNMESWDWALLTDE